MSDFYTTVYYESASMATSNRSNGGDILDLAYNKSLEKCLNLKPELSVKSKIISVKDIRSNLKSCNVKKSSRIVNKNLKFNNMSNDRTIIQNTLREISDDILSLHSKIEGLFSTMDSVLDKIECLETRIEILENNRASSMETYSSAVQRNMDEKNLNRVERLEYFASEQEREKRICELTITHPSFSKFTSNDFMGQLKNFFDKDLRMENREIDANMTGRKIKENTVLLQFSDRRFKGFLFSARKRLRNAQNSICKDLFINENLTPFNFKILKNLKNENKRRNSNGSGKFGNVYSFEGKVYVKYNDKAIHIKNQASLTEFLSNISNINP